MDRQHTPKDPPGRGSAASCADLADRDQLTTFLVDRLTEDLAALWDREEPHPGRPGPGQAAQLAVIDDLLTTLQAGGLPPRHELRILLFGYGAHPDYDPAWVPAFLS